MTRRAKMAAAGAAAALLAITAMAIFLAGTPGQEASAQGSGPRAEEQIPTKTTTPPSYKRPKGQTQY